MGTSQQAHSASDGSPAVYQVAAGYEDCNDADFLSIDPALRLAIGKGDDA